MTSVTLPGGTGVISTYSYDNADRLTGITHVQGGSTTIDSVAYTLDNVGNRTQRVDGAGTHAYSYDNLYRLTSVTYPGPNTTSYAFDAFGNRTSMTVDTDETTYAYDDADRLTSVTPPGESAITYTWDDNGNLTDRGSDEFEWDYEDRMVSATVGGTTTTFAYRGDGLRDSRTTGANTTTFTWDIGGGLPVVLDDGSQYAYGLGMVSQVSGSNTYYYLSDGLGSTMAMVDGGGTVVKSYAYDVYGKVTSSSGSAPNEFDFAGQQTDQTGLQYLRARYYDSEAGIFLSRDPMTRIAGWAGNPFGYVSANPVNLVDPRGLWPFTACSIACWKPATETNPLFAIEELFLGGTATNLYRVCSFVFVGEYKDCGTSTYTGQYLLDHWDDIMKPATAIASTIINGIDVLKLGRRGNSDRVREMKGDASDARALYEELAKGGQKVSAPGYKGEMVRLPDGTRIGFRLTSRSGPPTIDVHRPGQRAIEIKFKP